MPSLLQSRTDTKDRHEKMEDGDDFFSPCYYSLVEPLLSVNHDSSSSSSTCSDTDSDPTNNTQTTLKRNSIMIPDFDIDLNPSSFRYSSCVKKNQHKSQQLQQPPKSKNINLILLYTFVIFCSKSLWNQSVLSAFVYLLRTNDPEYVGFITANMGLAEFLSSIPAGYLADKYRRDTMLRTSSIVGILSAIWTAAAVSMEEFWILTIALALWGIFWGISFTSVSAMFADSIPEGDRSFYFTQRMILQLLGSAVGPMVAYLMFKTLGDVWTKGECAVVIQAGQLLSIPAFILLYFMKDDDRPKVIRERGEEEPSEEGNSILNDIEQTSNWERMHQGNKMSRKSDDSHDVATAITTMLGSEDASSSDTEMEDTTPLIPHGDESSRKSQPPNLFYIPGRRAIPILAATSDVVNGLATGMSLGYFPIFFLKTLKLRPDQVQIIIIMVMLSIACLSRVTQWVGTKIGRLQTTIILKYAGVIMFYAMNDALKQGESYGIVIGIFLLKSALMNAPKALTRSVLMDYVPREERAKWSSLESVNMFSWTGSAALGALLVDAKGILFNFTVSAWCQVVATFPLILALTFDSVRNESEKGIDG